MHRLPRPAGLVNGATAVVGLHTGERPIMGSSEGAAAREARATIYGLALALGKTPEDHAEDALRDAAYKAGELIGHRLADRSQAADLLRSACVTNGLVARLGEDAVQEAIASCFQAGEHAAAEERAEAEERELVARSSDPWHDPDWTLIEDRRGDLPQFPVETLPPAWRPWLERAARGAWRRRDARPCVPGGASASRKPVSVN